MSSAELNPRSGRILATVVREYIQTGEPVASMMVARRGALGVSSATVRNILVRLEEQGFVWQPHASAGRVPTDRGYRFYVNLLLESHRAPRTLSYVEALLRRQTGDDPLLDDVLAQVSHMLSTSSRHVGFALSPARTEARLHKLEFISIAAARVLVVVVVEGGQMLQKVVDLGQPLSSEELRRAAEYVNREFSGVPLAQVRAAVVARLAEERSLYDQLMARAYEIASQTLEGASDQHTIFVEGAASLLDADSTHAHVPIETLRALLELMEEKQRLVRLLNEYLDGPGLTVVIGAEHQDVSLRPFSLVASTFFDGQGTGSVGVIGPTRMRYSKAIAMVDGMAQAINRVLRESN